MADSKGARKWHAGRFGYATTGSGFFGFLACMLRPRCILYQWSAHLALRRRHPRNFIAWQTTSPPAEKKLGADSGRLRLSICALEEEIVRKNHSPTELRASTSNGVLSPIMQGCKHALHLFALFRDPRLRSAAESVEHRPMSKFENSLGTA